MPIESALVAIIPEAEDLVEAFRNQFDPAAPIGVPAHVTILYPFKPPNELTEEIIKTLQECSRHCRAFSVAFAETRRFPDVLYLAPDPAEPFRKLTESIVARFPETPPYGGVFTEVIPHLTIAQLDDAQQLDQIAAGFQEAAKGKLPIQARIDAIALMDNSSGRWQVRRLFPLHSGEEAS